MGTVVAVEVGAGAALAAGEGLRIKVVVEGVVLALFREVAAAKEETGKLTSAPVWPFTDRGSWMTSGWPAVTMLLPDVVFSTRVPGWL